MGKHGLRLLPQLWFGILAEKGHVAEIWGSHHTRGEWHSGGNNPGWRSSAWRIREWDFHRESDRTRVQTQWPLFALQEQRARWRWQP